MGKCRRNFKWKKNNKLIMIFIVIFVVLVTMSIGYAIYNDQLKIQGTANAIPIPVVEYPTLQAALDVVPTDGTEKTVIVIHDTAENVKVQAGQNVLLDIGNFTVGNLGAGAVIENNGDLEIVSGTITSNGNNAAINNKGGGILKLSGTTTIHV